MARAFLLFTAAATLHAQAPPQTPEPSGITSVIVAINKAIQSRDVSVLAELFSPDGDLHVPGSVLTGQKAIAERLSDRRPWSEVTPPRIENQTVRLITPDVALVDASWVQYGSTIVRRGHSVFLLLKRNGEQWSVVSMRLGLLPLPDTP
jgi:uncharacterized protein (TIGR02246 family)